jgi:hypothetical protein
MPHFFQAIAASTADALRAGGPDAYGNPAERAISDGGGNPCRHCLCDIAKGRPMLILAHMPFSRRQPYAETGPIFLCSDECPRHAETESVPPIIALRSRVLVKGYSQDERIAYGTGAIVDCRTIPEHLDELFSSRDCAFVDIRSASNNCYFCRAWRT